MTHIKSCDAEVDSDIDAGAETAGARGEEPFRLDRTLGYAVNRAAYLMRNRATREIAARGLDVTPEEWVILRCLAERDGRSQGEIADATIRDRTTVTRLIDGMVRKDLVRREPAAEDRRVVCAWLTVRGRRRQRRLVAVIREVLQQSTAQLADTELEITVRTLKQVQQNLIDSEQPEGEG